VRIRFTATARAEFLAAIEYIRKDKPGAAVQFRRKAEKALRRLNRFPDSGRKLPEFPDLPSREVVVPPYRFFYRVEQKTVWIVAVWHGAQQPDEP
jgi:toxin ParE1/3/4